MDVIERSPLLFQGKHKRYLKSIFVFHDTNLKGRQAIIPGKTS